VAELVSRPSPQVSRRTRCVSQLRRHGGLDKPLLCSERTANHTTSLQASTAHIRLRRSHTVQRSMMDRAGGVPLLRLVHLLLFTCRPCTAATIAFDWNVGDGSSVPARYLEDVTGTVGDTLVLSWQDPTTTPAGPMFHEAVQMTAEDVATCTFADGYTVLDKTRSVSSISVTVPLHTVGTFYISCGVGSAAWCATNTSTVIAATGGYGCSGDQAWMHCGPMFGQKIKVVVSDAGPKANGAASRALPIGIMAGASTAVAALWV